MPMYIIGKRPQMPIIGGDNETGSGEIENGDELGIFMWFYRIVVVFIPMVRVASNRVFESEVHL